MSKVNKPTRPAHQVHRLRNGGSFTLVDDLVCRCGAPLRPFDADALPRGAVRLICGAGCHIEIFRHEQPIAIQLRIADAE
jgi:hypothetical protein